MPALMHGALRGARYSCQRRARRFLAGGLALLAALLLAGCAGNPPQLADYLAPDDTAPVVLRDVPFHAQEAYQCGPAALAMGLGASGIDVAPATLKPKVWIPELKGSLQAEMVATARRYKRVPYIIEPDLPALLAELRGDHPVLVLLNLGWNIYPIWHYAVVIGYLPQDDALVLHSGTTREKVVATPQFMDNWHKAERWGMVLLHPGTLPAGDNPHVYMQAVAELEQVHPRAAEAAYAAATRRWPHVTAGWLGLGNTQYAQEDEVAAAQAWRTLLARQPDAAVVRNNLAQLLADNGCTEAAAEQIEIALDSADEAIRPAVLETRAGIYALPEGARSCPDWLSGPLP